jgi:alcohol dehydrogenase class IV
MLASTIGGMCICLAGVGLPHAMEHPVSGLYNVVHGQGLAAILPKVLRLNAEQVPHSLSVLAADIGLDTVKDAYLNAEQLCERVEALLDSLNLSCTLKQLGVQQKDIGWLAHNAMTLMNANAINNPYIPTEKEVRTLFESCM